MPTLLDELWDRIEWRPVEADGTPGPDADPPVPRVTHEGVLRVGDAGLRVYQLDDGRRVIEARDLWAFAREREVRHG